MDKCAILHQSDSRFSYPLNETKAQIRLRAKRDDTIAKVQLIWNTSHKFYQKQFLADMEVRYQDELYDYYVCELDNGCPGYSYLFKITDGDGAVYYYNESGIDTVFRIADAFKDNFNVVFPNKSDVVFPNKQFEGRVFYQIFPERFAKGSNKQYVDYIDMDWNTDEPVNDKFAGGDLDGVREKLPYLKNLGIGAVYMTPVHQSVSAHKYDVDDYFSVDKMFGGLPALKSLVDEAHRLDIKIVLDLVFNHSSFYNPLFQDVVKNGKKSKYYDWYYVYGDKPDWDKCNYNTFADVRMMPKLNTNNPATQDYLCSVGEFYLKEYGVDGFRLDVAFDVSHKFWRLFKLRMQAINPDVFIIGEDWQNSESFLGNDQWDSVMNYPFLYACQRFLGDNRYSAKGFCDYLNMTLMRYKDGTNRMMLNLLDSHDIERFYNTVGLNKQLQLIAIASLMFYQGCPMLYYGDEIFMDGKYDPNNRKCMRWDSPEYNSAEHKVILDLLRMRSDKVLRYGDIRVYERDCLACLERSYEGRTLTLAINHSGTSRATQGKPVYVYNCASGQMNDNSFAVYDVSLR